MVLLISKNGSTWIKVSDFIGDSCASVGWSYLVPQIEVDNKGLENNF